MTDAKISNVDAAKITTGTLADARLSANVSLLGQTIESSEITDGTIVNADISGSAAIADTKLATISTAGKVADTALSANVALRAGGNDFTGDQTVASGKVGIGTTSPALKLTVSGSGLYNSVNAAALLLTNTTANGHGWEWHALDSGSMQLADFGPAQTRMIIDTNGNIGIGANNPTNRLHVNGGVSATAYVTTSDRNAKENFAPVSPREVLDKVAALPITTWNFKEIHDGRHIGPMAQDFYAAFGLGGSDTTITTVDPDGVALAAIQGLNEKLEARSQKLEAENAELKQRLEKLERILNGKNGGAR